MNKNLIEKLKKIAISYAKDDPAHDDLHFMRVLNNAISLQKHEGGDLDVVIAGALFHDLVAYEKNDPRNKFSVKESAELAEEILNKINEFPKEKINQVKGTILATSFTYGKEAITIEEKIVSDADKLEATGIISVMRTFASSGRMSRKFYDQNDPFSEKREPDDMKYALDLFKTRLLITKDRMTTKTARKIATRRTLILKKVLVELDKELKGF